MVNFIFIILISTIFCNSEKVEFESANPFSFEDIILYLDDQEVQKVYGVLTFPENSNK